MLTALEKAEILVEALPYIKKFSGKTIVIKYGGHAMINSRLKQAVMTDLVLMKYVGINPVVVHGGGPAITGMLQKLGIESRFVNGLRVTDASTMEVVEMVLGKLNKEIVALLNRLGGRGVGLSGKDANLIIAAKKLGKDRQDMGFVGQVAQVNPQLIETVVKEGYIPVIAPVGSGPAGESYNINADTVAGAVATALQADKLIILTDVEGILADRSDQTSLLSTIKVEEIPALIERGIIQGGMIPKVECCVNAIKGGVTTTHILDGRVPHAILLEVFTDKGIGTMVVGDK
ncbi:acetylglutamate kinase [Desulforamulus hydrothermalis]|uniref:Acetylglutamate kinase n=1 Tax=Desulforamulus hydrothermalis Lam5 = DSM 18033 TaxID=1121428 RepID=K8EGS6_9FIRM|nr:acetylglutamate kinase [Desulforamulus hydrothermalis]CCO07841.1 Acetylglutamate kinase [Desulforamulus hydrothermalis Lam5 = DSM 18033]SHH27468.1 N-acetylglutamate kinase [Desulforamulus hydrothermalis Lam5 = DSM 18033]